MRTYILIIVVASIYGCASTTGGSGNIQVSEYSGVCESAMLNKTDITSLCRNKAKHGVDGSGVNYFYFYIKNDEYVLVTEKGNPTNSEAGKRGEAVIYNIISAFIAKGGQLYNGYSSGSCEITKSQETHKLVCDAWLLNTDNFKVEFLVNKIKD